MRAFEISEAVSSVAFSPDGNILAATSKEVIFWEAATGRELGRTTVGSEGGARAFSPDGRLLAVATRSHVEIWRLPFGYQRDRPAHAESERAMGLKGQEDLVTVFLLPYVESSYRPVEPSVAFSPDASKVAASAGGAVVEDLTNRQQIFAYYPLRTPFASDVGLSPDGKAIAFATDKGVYVSDVPSTQPAGSSANADPSGIPGQGKK